MNKDRAAVLAAAERAREVLDGGQTLFAAGMDASELRELTLLTTKPFIYVFNLDADEFADDELKAKLSQIVAPAASCKVLNWSQHGACT